MANRRMFSLDIVDTDAFLSLSLSAQALYFHLGMRADDDGFVSSPYKIMRFIGANASDLQNLIDRKFVLLMNDGIIIIKHWWMHNTKRKDTYKPTNYIEDANLLYLDNNKAYTEKRTDKKFIPLTESRNSVNEPLTQDKISKDKISKVKLSKDKLIDKTRYKHFDKCDEIIQKLISCGYITQNSLDLEDYFQYLDDLFDAYDTKDVKIKIDYFIRQVCSLHNENGKPVLLANDKCNEIDNKYLYFARSLSNALRSSEIDIEEYF